MLFFLNVFALLLSTGKLLRGVINQCLPQTVTRIMFCHTEEENYARDVLKGQLMQGWPGLAQEVVNICKNFGLPNACLEYVHRKEVSEAVLMSPLKVLKEEYKMQKIKHL